MAINLYLVLDNFYVSVIIIIISTIIINFI